MSKLNFYKYAALALLCLNLVMLALFAFAPPPKGGHNRPAKRIMHLNEEQHDFFLQDVARHKALMADFRQNQRELLEPYFQQIIQPQLAVNADSLLIQIQQIERQKVESVYQHFLNIKQTLKPEQHEGFELFVNGALREIFYKKNAPARPSKKS